MTNKLYLKILSILKFFSKFPGYLMVMQTREYIVIKRKFDKDYYFSSNPDLRRGILDPVAHYLRFGWKEGRNPCKTFSTNGYLATHNDLRLANINPFYHFLTSEYHGKSQPKNLSFDIMNNYVKDYKRAGYSLKRVKKSIEISGNGLIIRGLADNTIYTGLDVLCKEEYFFVLNEPYVMIDVGFNLGMTSLYFARNKNIKKIYGFEPFIPTLKQGLENIQNNPNLSKKITVFNYGLGGKDEIVKSKYNPDRPGAMSSVREVFSDATNIEIIKIKKASTIIRQILNNHKKEKIFLKIDCEGAENDILNDLKKHNILKNIDTIILEWHFKEPGELIQILNRSNFFVFSEHTFTNELGMIRAHKIMF